MTTQDVEEIKRHFDEAVQGLRSDVTGLQSDVTGLRSDVTGLRSDVTGLRSDVTGLQSDVTGLQSDVRGLRGDVTGLQSDVAGLRSEMTAEFANVHGELSQFRRDSAEVADHLMEKIADARHEARVQTGELRTLIQTVAEGVVLANERLDALTSAGDVPRRTPPPRRH